MRLCAVEERAMDILPSFSEGEEVSRSGEEKQDPVCPLFFRSSVIVERSESIQGESEALLVDATVHIALLLGRDGAL